MADRNYSSYQQKIISRYYNNRDQMDHQKLAELVTNLYLSEGKKLAKHWETAENVMTRLGVPASRVTHIMNKKDPQILAVLVEEIQKGKVKLTPPKAEKKKPASKKTE